MKSIRIWHSLFSWLLISLPTIWYFKLHSQPGNLQLSVFLLFCALNILLFYIGLGNLLNSERLGHKTTQIIQLVTFPLFFIPLMFFVLYWQDMAIDLLIRLSGSEVIHDSGLRFKSWQPRL